VRAGGSEKSVVGSRLSAVGLEGRLAHVPRSIWLCVGEIVGGGEVEARARGFR
jgi:hypothetical protein